MPTCKNDIFSGKLASVGRFLTKNALVFIDSCKLAPVPFKQRRSPLRDKAGAISHNPVWITYGLPTIRLEPMVNASQGRFMLSARRVFRHNGQLESSKLGGGVLLLESVP